VSFYNEALSIGKITGAQVTVTEFDTECSPPVSMEKYVRKRERVKNGGTDFRPVFQMADRMRVPLLIIFTDGEGTAPEQANQRVLWVLTENGKKPAEYGHYVAFKG
jgi:predicted metal-dependent peptidase